MTITIFCLRCEACGFQTSALTHERMQAWMLEHLIAVHSG
jgi:hypothetical protein